jgi:hypothetical protein
MQPITKEQSKLYFLIFLEKRKKDKEKGKRRERRGWEKGEIVIIVLIELEAQNMTWSAVRPRLTVAALRCPLVSQGGSGEHGGLIRKGDDVKSWLLFRFKRR